MIWQQNVNLHKQEYFSLNKIKINLRYKQNGGKRFILTCCIQCDAHILKKYKFLKLQV